MAHREGSPSMSGADRTKHHARAPRCGFAASRIIFGLMAEIGPRCSLIAAGGTTSARARPRGQAVMKGTRAEVFAAIDQQIVRQKAVP
jgi:hypothetical protein